MAIISQHLSTHLTPFGIRNNFSQGREQPFIFSEIKHNYSDTNHFRGIVVQWIFEPNIVVLLKIPAAYRIMGGLAHYRSKYGLPSRAQLVRAKLDSNFAGLQRSLSKE